MAEPKTQYQFGLKSLDMDSYIRNIGSNVRSYIDYNVKHRGWTEDQVNEFTQSYEKYLQAFLDQLKNKTTRFSTNDLGDIVDSQGEFNNIDKNSEGQPEEFYYNGKGERIDQSQYNALRDKKKKKYTTFNANREVAEYFRRVGTKLSEYKAPPKDKFDVNKHGFVAWWQKTYNPASNQVYIQPYLDLDPVGADGKRPVINRATKAALWMNEYLDYMKDQDLDFSDYAINNVDDYIAKGQTLAQEWSNGNWTPEDLIKAQEFGVLPEFSEGYFSTEEDPSLSPTERQALAERLALLEQQLQQLQQQQLQQQRTTAANQWIEEQIAKYKDNLTNALSNTGSVLPGEGNVQPILLGESDPFKGGHIAPDPNTGRISYTDPDNTSMSSQYQKDLTWLGGLGINIRNSGTGLGYDPNKLYQAFVEFARNPYQYNGSIASGVLGALLRLAMAAGNSPYAQVIKEGKYAGNVWFPHPGLLENFNRALVYNPDSQQLEYVFVGYIPEIWNEMKNKYLTGLGIDPNVINALDFTFDIPSQRLGGKFQSGGVTQQAFVNGFNDFNTANKNLAATRRGVSTDQLARLRRPVSKGISLNDAANDNLMEQLGGWTARDYWQLANIGADITSMVSAFVPGYGTIASAATGAGSSISQFIYDLGDDTTGFLGDLGNLAVGLGMDLVGLIPGFGATSKGAKIAKNLIKYVPRLMAVIGTYQGLGNSPQIMASLRKAKNGEDLTVDDWKNIAQGIGIATGIGGGAVRHVQTRHVNPHLDANSSLMPKGRLRNLIQKPTETGDVAVQLRNKNTKVVETRKFTGDDATAIRNATSPADIEKIVFKNNLGLGDYELVNSSSLRPHLRWGWPPLYHPEKVRAMAVQRSATGKEYVEGNWHQRDIQPVAETLGEGAYRRAFTENPTLKRAAKASKDYENKLSQKAAKIADADKNIADIRNKAAEYQRDNGLVGGDISKSIQDIDRQITAINANRRGNVGQAPDAAFRARQLRFSDLNQLILNKTSEINTIKASGSRKGLKKAQDELAALLLEYDSTKKWLSDNDASVVTGLQQHRKALEDFDIQIGNQTKEKNTWEGYTDLGHTVAYTRLKAKAKNGKISFTDPDNPRNVITRDFNQVMKDLGIIYRVGGKFETGGGIRDVQGNADWFTHMYGSDAMKNWLKTFNQNNYIQFNSLLDSWENNFTESGYTPGGNAIYNTGVLMRLPVWNNNGTNAVIGDLRTRGILTGNGGTTDNAAGNYTDGYFGAQEYLRHGGTKTSWEGHETELQALQEQFKTQGLEYYLDKDNGMYKLRPLNVAKAAGDADDNDQSDVTQAYGDREDLKDKPTIDKNKLTNYVNPKWLAFGQAMYANAVNDRMTDRALESNKAVLYDPKNDTRYLQGDLDALMTGQMAAGQLMHIGSQPITSDGSLYAATMLDAAAKGEEYKIQGRTTNNTALRKRAQEILEQRITDHAFNYDVANKNRLALYLTAANRTTLLNARDSKNYDNQKTLFDEIMYDVKSDWNRRRTIQESLDKADIHSRVLDNLEQYVPDLTDAEKAAWNKVRNGEATYTQLQGDEAVAYRSALKKASQAETNQLRILYGLPTVNYASSNTTNDDGITIVNRRQGGVLVSKDGSKIRVAKIRAESRERIKNADRFYHTTKDRHDRTDKNIARADKKMYPLNKPISSRRTK